MELSFFACYLLMVTQPQQEICENVFFVRSGSVFEFMLVLFMMHSLII